MFTGIIENKGKVVRVEHRGQEKRLFLTLPIDLTEVQLGDSISINGVCLTLAESRGTVVKLDLSSETLQKSNLGELTEGDLVNFERALKLTDRLGGHIVTGHIDGIGLITERRKEGDFLQLRIRIPRSLLKYVVQQGSIAIEGVSLTVNECKSDEIKTTLIPYTLAKTNLIDKKVGDSVNIETDIIGKYVEKMMNRRSEEAEGLTLSFLKEHGFIDSE